MIILLEKLTVSHHNESLQKDSSDNSVRIVNCITSQNVSTAGQ